MSALRPDSNKGHDLGSSSVKWGTLHVGDVQAETMTTTGNVEIQGNLTVTGSQTALSVTTVEANDPLIKLAKNNTADTVDIGFYGLTNDGSSDQYHGLARDADDEKFYLFKDASEPTTVMPSLASQNTATLVANIEGNIVGDLTGNADTASALETSRTLSISGDASGSATFDGSADADIDITIGSGVVLNSMMANSTITLAGDSGSQAIDLGDTLTIQGTANEIVTSQSGDVLTIALPDSVSGLTSVSATSFTGALTGNASTATTLETARTIEVSGDVAGSASFDGSASIDIVTTIQAGSVENSMLANNGLDIYVDGVSQERVQLGDKLDFNGTTSQVAVSYSAADNDITFSLPSTINVDTSGNAATATAQETARNFSISSNEMTATAVSYDGTGNVVLAPALVAGSVANSKLANSIITFGNGLSDSDIALGGSVTISGTSDQVDVSHISGTFQIGLPATIDADTSGNAATATALETSRNFSIGSGPVQASAVAFDGTGNVSLTTTIANDQITNAMLANDKLVIQVNSVDYDRELGSTLKFAKGGDLTLNYSAVDNEVTYSLPSELTVDTTGNAATATALETARTFAIGSGPIRATAVSFDGTGNVSLTSTIEDDSIGNAKLVNDHWGLKLDGVAQEDIALGVDLDFVSGTDIDISYSAVNNTLTVSLEAEIGSDTTGNAATATAQETARDFSISSSEMTASAVSYDATGNVVLVPSLVAGSVANAKLANSDINFGNGLSDSNIALGGDVVIQGTANEVDVGYSAGTFTIGLPATIQNNTTGNAATATALETSRTLSISGDVTGSVSFDGTGNANIVSTIQTGAVENSMLSNSSITIGDGVSSEAISLGGEFEIKGTTNEVEVAYSIVDNEFVIGLPETISSNAATATALETARTLSISGDASGSASFDGTANANIAITIGTDAVENSMILNDYITMSDGSASNDVALGGTLTIQGTSNEVEVSQSSGTFTLGLPNSVTVNSNLTVGGNITASSAALTVDSMIALSNVTIGGNLSANGASVSFKDNLVELGVNNVDIEDIGFYGQRGDGSSSLGFAGFAWDESIDKFVAFTASSSDEPTSVVGQHNLAELSVKNVTISEEYSFPTSDGLDGQVLTTDGNGNVAFESIPSANTYPHISLNSSSVPINLADQSGSYSEQILIYVGSDADLATVTLPSSPTNGFRITIKNTDGVNTLKYQRGGTNTIEGSATSQDIPSGEAITLVFRTSTWYKIGRFH